MHPSATACRNRIPKYVGNYNSNLISDPRSALESFKYQFYFLLVKKGDICSDF
jgi:hypothetical protein